MTDEKIREAMEAHREMRAKIREALLVVMVRDVLDGPSARVVRVDDAVAVCVQTVKEAVTAERARLSKVWKDQND